jgi:hypothetical protein
MVHFARNGNFCNILNLFGAKDLLRKCKLSHKMGSESIQRGSDEECSKGSRIQNTANQKSYSNSQGQKCSMEV